ncbi:hypothetical protein Fot_51563 [Forsythia ovata]|uniref:Uncharacterized protein n=1 Tax=Forsythia ovata TaxID=205694 RepID=A0ABD1PXE8_9LAMI
MTAATWGNFFPLFPASAPALRRGRKQGKKSPKLPGGFDWVSRPITKPEKTREFAKPGGFDRVSRPITKPDSHDILPYFRHQHRADCSHCLLFNGPSKSCSGISDYIGLHIAPPVLPTPSHKPLA